MALFNKCFDNMIAATAALAPLAQGENGSWEHTQASVGDSRVGLFFGLVRDTRRERIASLFADCVGQARSLIVKGKKDEAAALVADLFVLAFQTRDCRGGKGEKNLFYSLLEELYRVYPETVGRLLHLIPEYGYYKDFTLLVTHLVESEHAVAMQSFQQQLMIELARLLKRDAQKFDEAIAAGKNVSEISLSLVSKYAPREGKIFAKSYRELFHFFLEQMFPHSGSQEHPKVLYRRLLAKISPAVQTVETKMCGKRFSDIAFDSVPSVASKKYRKAFLNESLELDCHESQLETGNRHPEDADRLHCRQHFIDHIMSGEVKGKQLFPHEIVREFMHLPPPTRRGVAVGRGGSGRGGGRGGAAGRGRGVSRRAAPVRPGVKTMSSMEKHMLCSQWKSLREHIVSTLQAKRQEGKAPAIDLGRLVPLVDVSGSMEGTPMEVAIAMGILVSEINDVTFRHRFLTFETSPQWVQLNETMTLEEKVRKTKDAPWGGSTNFYAAMKLIANVVETHRLPMEEVPDLIVFSDMQFDQAGHGKARQTQLQLIQQLFHNVGMKVANQPYPAPRIIFWNLRGGPTGFPAISSEDNVQMLSGYSPSLFKFVVEGEEVTTEEEKEETPTAMDVDRPLVAVAAKQPAAAAPTKKKIDPYATLRKVLDDERYFSVREVLSASTESELAWYQFTRPV